MENCCYGETCCNDSDAKTVLVQYLHLDLKACDRCIGADAVLEDVLLTISPALETAGYSVKLKKEEIASEELAKEYHFLASHTIRVNGRDICEAVEENACGCCGEISGNGCDLPHLCLRGEDL